MDTPLSLATAPESSPSTLGSLQFPGESAVIDELNRQNDQAERLNIAVNAGVMAWLRKQGINPADPQEQRPSDLTASIGSANE